MNYDNYDINTHSCKTCGMLMPDDPLCIKNHNCWKDNPGAMFKKEEVVLPTPKFKKGAMVEVQMVAFISQVLPLKNGVLYKVVDNEGSSGWIAEEHLFRLPEPADFKGGGI